MNYQRIEASIDVAAMKRSHVTVVGGAYGLGRDLARSGLGGITFVDFDRVDEANVTRQDFSVSDIGKPKVKAAVKAAQMVNPDIRAVGLQRDFCSIPRWEFDRLFGHTSLFVLAPDRFLPNARGNIESHRLGKPAIWIGLYSGARAGELIYQVPGGFTEACYRCICGSRYDSFRKGAAPTASDGGTIHDLHLMDAIASQICVGILTRGANNRFGRLIEQLGKRNLLQIKIDPEYRLGTKDIFKKHLGRKPANFSFNTIALRMEAEPDCPDCGGVGSKEGQTCAGF